MCRIKGTGGKKLDPQKAGVGDLQHSSGGNELPPCWLQAALPGKAKGWSQTKGLWTTWGEPAPHTVWKTLAISGRSQPEDHCCNAAYRGWLSPTDFLFTCDQWPYGKMASIMNKQQMICFVSPALAITKTIRWYKLLHRIHVDFYQLGIWLTFYLVQEGNKTQYRGWIDDTGRLQSPQTLAGGRVWLFALTSWHKHSLPRTEKKYPGTERMLLAWLGIAWGSGTKSLHEPKLSRESVRRCKSLSKAEQAVPVTQQMHMFLRILTGSLALWWVLEAVLLTHTQPLSLEFCCFGTSS